MLLVIQIHVILLHMPSRTISIDCGFLSNFQNRTDRIVFKLFGKDPNDFPVALRTQVYSEPLFRFKFLFDGFPATQFNSVNYGTSPDP